MVLKTVRQRAGRWAFLIGVVLAVLFGAIGTSYTWVLWILVIAGIIVGFMNIADEEVTPFLWSSVALIIATGFGGAILDVLPFIGGILNALLVLFVPATIVVAVKHVFSFARH